MTEKKQLTNDEILKQLPDDIQNRRFTSGAVEGYTSVWEGEQESTGSLIFRKIRQNPFIPLGLVGTCYFLGRGILNMGNSAVSQKMMRGRVLAQGFTITALVLGFTLESYREERREKEQLREK